MILEKIHEEGMIPGERGIMSKKGIYFHSPSPFAKEPSSSAYTGELNISVHRPTRSAERVCTLTFFSAFCQGNCILHTGITLSQQLPGILFF